MSNDTRQKVSREAESISLIGCSLGEARKIIKELIERYGVNGYIDWYQHKYTDDRYMYVFVESDETDAEMQDRLALEMHYAECSERRDKEEFKRLTEKFGSKK